jgi:hypothetical protein
MAVGSGGGASGSTAGHFHVTADNAFEAYVNGQEVGTGSDWTVTCANASQLASPLP